MIDLEAEKKEIKRLWKEAIDAENRRDLESIQRMYAEDVIWQRPDQPEIRGKKALLEVLSSFSDGSRFFFLRLR